MCGEIRVLSGMVFTSFAPHFLQPAVQQAMVCGDCFDEEFAGMDVDEWRFI
jgi:hypothetical protein